MCMYVLHVHTLQHDGKGIKTHTEALLFYLLNSTHILSDRKKVREREREKRPSCVILKKE